MSACLLTAALLLVSAAQVAPSALPQDAASLTHDQSNLPTIPALLQKVRAAQAESSAGQQRYLCHQTLRIERLPPGASQRVTEGFQFETFSVNGNAISRMLQRDGSPLNPAEQQAEEQRVAQQADAALTHMAPAPLWENTLGGLILQRASLRHERRILVNGRTVIAFDLHPHDTTGPRTSMDVIAEHVQGDVWIDEQDAAIVRMEAMAPSDITFFSSLLVPRGYRVSCFRAVRLSDGVYMPQSWCGSRFPNVSLAERNPAVIWHQRVERQEHMLDGCRLYRSTSRVVPLSDPGER